MRVAVTSSGPSLESTLDPRFGRCAWFVLVDTDTMVAEAVRNPHESLGGGAGIQSAQLMAQRAVKFVLTGNCGPNAHQTLGAAGIGVILGCTGTVRGSVERFNAGELTAASAPNVASHAGMPGKGAR